MFLFLCRHIFKQTREIVLRCYIQSSKGKHPSTLKKRKITKIVLSIAILMPLQFTGIFLQNPCNYRYFLGMIWKIFCKLHASFPTVVQFT